MHIGPNNSVTFDSMADFADWTRNDRCISFYQDGKSSDWSGDATAAQAMKMLRTGDTSRVAAAEAMLSKFDLQIETTGSVMDVGVAGFCPSVPDYLGGSPESMFYMADAPSSVAPLKILVDCTSSSGITTEQLNQRGTTILAAVMALSATRPVSLEVACLLDCGDAYKKNCPGNSVSIFRLAINSQPLDLGSACYALSHPAFSRILVYGAVQSLFESPLAWPAVRGIDMRATRSQASTDATLALMGEDPEQTLFIPCIHLHDELTTNPVKWVNQVLEKYGQPAMA